MASMKQVSRSLFRMLTQTAGWESSRLTTSSWPEPAAYMRGTQPRQLRAFTSTPASRHRRTVARSPLSAAPQIPPVLSSPASLSVRVLTESDLPSPVAISPVSLSPVSLSHSISLSLSISFPSADLTVQQTLRRQCGLGGWQEKINNTNTTTLLGIVKDQINFY